MRGRLLGAARERWRRARATADEAAAELGVRLDAEALAGNDPIGQGAAALSVAFAVALGPEASEALRRYRRALVDGASREDLAPLAHALAVGLALRAQAIDELVGADRTVRDAQVGPSRLPWLKTAR